MTSLGRWEYLQSETASGLVSSASGFKELDFMDIADEACIAKVRVY